MTSETIIVNYCSCTLRYYPLPVFIRKAISFYYLASTVNYSNCANFFDCNRPVQRQRRSQPYKKTRQTQSKKAEREWIKNLILLLSSKVKTVPRNQLRETLLEVGFVISGFKLKSSASQKELTSSIEKVLSDKITFIPSSPKFNFVRAVEKKIVETRTAEEITGELLRHFCGPTSRPIFKRPISYDLSFLLSAPELFVDPNDNDDDLLDQYLFNESIIDFNDKDEPLEGLKNHTDPTKSDQPKLN